MPVWYFYNSQTLLRGRNFGRSTKALKKPGMRNDKRIMELLFSLCGLNTRKNVSLSVGEIIYGNLSMVARGDDGWTAIFGGSTAGGPLVTTTTTLLLLHIHILNKQSVVVHTCTHIQPVIIPSIALDYASHFNI